MSYAILVSNGYIRLVHGTWKDPAAARETAARWNRVYAKKGWGLTASAVPVVGKSAKARDRLGAMLVEAGKQSLVDELARLDYKVCPCPHVDVDPDTVDDDHPEGVCACGHVPDEHENGREQCDAAIPSALDEPKESPTWASP